MRRRKEGVSIRIYFLSNLYGFEVIFGKVGFDFSENPSSSIPKS